MDPNNSQYDLAFSVAVVGDPATGKSTLVQQETTSFFNNGNGFVYADKGASEVSVEVSYLCLFQKHLAYFRILWSCCVFLEYHRFVYLTLVVLENFSGQNISCQRLAVPGSLR
jgi:GTPase SAR1 family protein